MNYITEKEESIVPFIDNKVKMVERNSDINLKVDIASFTKRIAYKCVVFSCLIPKLYIGSIIMRIHHFAATWFNELIDGQLLLIYVGILICIYEVINLLLLLPEEHTTFTAEEATAHLRNLSMHGCKNADLYLEILEKNVSPTNQSIKVGGKLQELKHHLVATTSIHLTFMFLVYLVSGAIVFLTQMFLIYNLFGTITKFFSTLQLFIMTSCALADIASLLWLAFVIEKIAKSLYLVASEGAKCDAA